MRDIRLVQQENEDDVIAVTSWCDEMYDGIFAPYFKDVRKLYKRLQSKSRPITDDELEEILTMLPLNLFSVSESLNKFRTELEVHKMKMKQKKKEYVDSSIETSETRRTADAQYRLIEDELLCTAYSNVIARVEGEVSFSRELIMSAKKLWDGRRGGERVNPVSEGTTEPLPDYNPNSTGSNTYIHG